jgi:hypothetical protein
MSVIKPIVDFHLYTYALVKAKNLVGISSSTASVAGAKNAADSITKGAKIGAAIALVVIILVSWGTFLYVVGSGAVTPGSVAFNTLLAQTIAATIIAIIQFVLSLNPLGAIAVAIFGIVDLLLFILGVNFSLNGWITEQLGKVLYHFELTVNSDIDTGSPDLNLVNPNDGMVEGAWMAVNMPITTTIKHRSPQDGWGWRVAPYLPIYYTLSNLKSTTFAYSLSVEPATFDVDRDDMRKQWQTAFDRTYAASPFYRGQSTADPTTNVTLTAGINQPLSLYLNNSYALPGVECWTIPIPAPPGFAPVCIEKTIDGSGSSDIGSSILLDVLPATLDEFVTFNWGGNVPFPVQPDWDNDGLMTRDLNGPDPDDFQWDSDHDGLSDSYEKGSEDIFLDPDSADSDNDGLSDFDEIRFGTNPGFSDTDQDGLKDGEEVWHLDPNTNTWTGGYTFTVNITATNNSNLPQQTLRVFSDPLNADGDGDGMADGLEKALHLADPVAYPFHPNAFNESPIALYLTFDDADGFVRPNQSVTISATVNNNLANPLFALGNYTLTLPSELDDSQTTADFNIFQDGTDSIVTTANVSTGNSGPITITADSLARLHNGDLSWSYAWSPVAAPDTRTVGSNVIRYAQITANPAGDSRYAIASLEGSGLVVDQAEYDALRVWKNGQVMVSTASITIGNPKNVEYPNPDVGHTTKIGESEPAIACNADGLCAEAYVEVAWPQGPQICSNVFLRSVWVRHAADVEGLTVRGEYYLTQNGTKIWGTRSGGDGAFLHDDKTIVVCPADKIRAWEEDDSPNADDDLGFHYLDLTAPHSDVAEYNNDDRIDLYYNVLPTAAYRYGAIRFLNSDLTFPVGYGRQFIEVTDGGADLRQAANPAIATSGSTWLVGFESYGSPTEVYTQLFVNNASGERVERLDNTDHLELGVDDHNLSLVWAGNQYIAVWESDTAPNIDEHSLKMAFLNRNGYVTARQIVAANELARSAEMMPDIAYSAEQNQSLVVYMSSNRLHGRFIQGNSVGEKFIIGTADAGAVLNDPNVVYDVINGVWVVNWLHVSTQGTTSKTRALAYNAGNNTARDVAFYEIDAPGRDVTDLACAPPNPGQLINRNIRAQTFCGVVTSDGRLGTNSMQFDSLQLEGTPPWLGGGGALTNQALASLTVDTLPPTITFGNFADDPTLAITDTFVFDGSANDTTSPIAMVRVNVDNMGWQTATGTASWSFAWNNIPTTDRDVKIQVEATDAVGYTGTTSITIHLDRTAPTTTFNQTADQYVTAIEASNDRYHLTFSGTASDSNDVAAVEALISPNGSGWQTATLSNNGDNWTVDYVLPQFPEGVEDSNLTGDFTLTLRARDSLGNSTDSNAYPVLPFRMDNTPPAAALLDYGYHHPFRHHHRPRRSRLRHPTVRDRPGACGADFRHLADSDLSQLWDWRCQHHLDLRRPQWN